MIASTVLVLSALTVTGIYVRKDEKKANDNGYTIDLSSNTEFYKYYKITQTGGGDWQPVQMSITATKRVGIESTSSDYDFYVDTNTWKAFK